MCLYSRLRSTNITKTAPVVCIVVMIVAAGVAARPADPHHGFLGGPWELLVKMGHEGDALRWPLSVADENKPQAIDATLPVIGTPIKVKLERYLPDLTWDTFAAADPNGGAVARLSLRGENLKQDLWLSAREVTRQAISSHLGSVAIRELPGGQASAAVLQQLTDENTAGVLLVWLAGSDSPLVYAAKPGRVTALPGSPWKLSVLQYLPHYSIDKETKEVANRSDQPVNPALEILVEGDDKEFRQWVWSKFPSSPHRRLQIPFRVQFVDFHLTAGSGHYILAAVPGQEPRLLYRKDGQKHLEPAALGKRYSFQDERYSFAMEELRHQARIQTQWKNSAEMLLHPAIVAMIVQGDSAKEAVLELNKPYHHKTELGTLVVLYRRVPQMSKEHL